ncbi:MAG: DUF411 domain-containing protein [Xanthobacteraceae bacterium]|nr:DUF411 domain-containing protein [Xanthobacteraceae bacterium]
MSQPSDNLTRRTVFGILTAALIAPRSSAFAEASTILVHKDPKCGCCAGWVQHLKDAGFTVTVQETAQLQAVRKRLGVPGDLAACHTAEVAGYVIEGHVPAAAIRELLEKRPVAAGLAVPGMPVGSPGMQGGTPQKYDVVIFENSGRRTFMQFIGTKATG